MNCKKMEKVIFTDYIDGNLKGRALEDAELHLRSCPTCYALAEDLKSAGKLFKAVRKETAPSEVWHKIHSEISAQPVKRHFLENTLDQIQDYLPHLRPAVVIASAAVLLLFILATVRLAPNKDYLQTVIAQDEILSISYDTDEADASEYDLGTPAEMFFL